MNKPDTTPYWKATAALPDFPSLSTDLTVDAVVIGGGVTGATTALLLKEAGFTVALIDRGKCGHGDTSYTSAHLTAISDRTFPDLVKSLGRDHAEAVWDAGFAAIDEIARIVEEREIDCDFQIIPGYLTEALDDPKDDQRTLLEETAQEAVGSGFDAEFIESIPGFERPGVRFDGQARFHPLKYLAGVLSAIPGNGSHVFENSNVDEVTDDPLTVKTRNYTITASFVVVATHVPIMGKTGFLKATLLQTDLYPYSSYVLGARVEKGRWPDALIWDLQEPYHFVRLSPGEAHDTIIFGGQDHKTGQADDTSAHYEKLEALLERLIPGAEVTHRWSGQVIETRDRLPYIGETSKNQFAITGFCGNGLTFGTLGAMMARDAATGKLNPWSELFDAGRTQVARGLWNYLKENKDYPYYLIRDRFAGAEGKSLREVRAGEGRLLDWRGKRVAAYRGKTGRLTVLSPVCTHMGCHVDWNETESTWDCPCHGSRFTAKGKVMAGPAETDLKAVDRTSS
jgi:glycine/D-amino acid oxidase-like deaminating enzyme/nitrite reductase/ring-hydroxylating ferredoxin subunit